MGEGSEEFFRKEMRATTTTTRRNILLPSKLFFSAAKFRGEEFLNFWREERTRRNSTNFFLVFIRVLFFLSSFIFFFLSRKGWVSNGRDEFFPFRNFFSKEDEFFEIGKAIYSPILFSFAEDYILRQCFTLRNEFQDVERARKEGSFNDLDLGRGLENTL